MRVGALPAMCIRVGLAALLLAPLAWAGWASLQPVDRIFIDAPAGEPQWRNYAIAVERLPFVRFLANSGIITTTATLGTVLTASMAGFAFARLRWRGRDACFVLLMATMLVPDLVLLVPRFLVFRSLGWVNTYKPLIVPAWLGGGAFYVFLFRQFFRTLPRELEDSARLDGASWWQVYWRIALPMSKPVFAATISIAAVAHWQAFAEPLIYLSDFHDYPVSVGLRMYFALQGSWPNLVMAASLIALLPPLLVVLLTQRYLMRGLFVGRGG